MTSSAGAEAAGAASGAAAAGVAAAGASAAGAAAAGAAAADAAVAQAATAGAAAAEASGVPERPALRPGAVEALEAFATHLGAERGRSEHTTRAYLGDVRTLLEFAAARGLHDLAELDLRALRAWLASLTQA